MDTNSKNEPTVLHEGKYLRFLDYNGWEYTERIKGHSVVMIVPMTESNELVLIEQFRAPVRKSVIEFPMGIVGDLEASKDEVSLEAAKRELEEETGFAAREWKHCFSGPVHPAVNSMSFDVFVAKDLTKVSEGGGDETEDILVHQAPYSEVSQFLQAKQKQGFLIDPKIFMGCYWLSQTL